MLLWNPLPDVAGLGKDPQLWDAYRNAYYEVADEQDVPLLDLGGAWKDFATANALGMFADVIHPGNRGSAGLADLVEHALFAL